MKFVDDDDDDCSYFKTDGCTASAKHFGVKVIKYKMTQAK